MDMITQSIINLVFLLTGFGLALVMIKDNPSIETPFKHFKKVEEEEAIIPEE